ncbi:MAG: proline--tRNA ligase [Nitrospirae bacterium]|nr:MAG: proline--tRNA ligase [Nitrospirota bacterium]
MHQSQLLIPTLREDPGEAEIVSHRLMLRAGMIRKVAAGIYTYLPLGLRVIRKVERIIREELDKAGAQEVLMPIASPAELWLETGRWDFYGKELFRFKDRHERDFCLGPTHEEVITDLVRREVRSYRQLPANFYQIQTKFRDEIRPRFGLMRGREFIMKDAYSFDADEAGAKESYRKMYEAYKAIFTRCGLTFRPVEADTGLIGGTSSHEFMVLADTGEEGIAVCDACDYAANVERAELVGTGVARAPVALANATGGGPPPVMQEHAHKPPADTLREKRRVPTPGKKTVEEVTAFLNVPATQLVKTLLYRADGKPVAVLVRGDHEINEVKLKKALGATDLVMADPALVAKLTGAPVGFAGPIGLSGATMLADWAVRPLTNIVVGGNAADTHWVDVTPGRDFTPDRYADIRNAIAGDACPRCAKPLRIVRGIEVGHVFMLGTKYSEKMKAHYLDKQGQECLIVMGCYGIGVGRTSAAAIEQNHDAKGIIWPAPIAPFHVHILPLAGKGKVLEAAIALETELTRAGIEVLVDDRDERPGVKFNDADLIGCPHQVVIGEKNLSQGLMELKERRTGTVTKLPHAEITTSLIRLLKLVSN